jgi:rhodanese-related sulfurtransferase
MAMSQRVWSAIPCSVFDDDDNEPPTDQLSPPYPIPILLPSRDPIPKISTTTLDRLIRGNLYGIFETLVVLDCRFPYEYEAGHISVAVNLTNLELMRDLDDQFRGRNVCFVFHCAFSHTRGPTWAKIFREFDRLRNLKEGRGPNTYYPNVFVLNGGYKACFTESPGLTLGKYRRMEDLNEREYGLYTQGEANFRSQTARAANWALFSAFAHPTREEPVPEPPRVQQFRSQPCDVQIAPPNLGLALAPPRRTRQKTKCTRQYCFSFRNYRIESRL